MGFNRRKDARRARGKADAEAAANQVVDPMAIGLAFADSDDVAFHSNSYLLHGCITRPKGNGPFPVVIYNHGSEKYPDPSGPPALRRAYLERGYLFFSFHRHGHGRSPGEYIMDLLRTIDANESDLVLRGQRITALHESYNLDVIGAVEWLLKRPEVDRNRVVMTGISHGGIQTLLTAEKGFAIRAFIAFAPGAMASRNAALHSRMETAVRNATAPLFLAQARNDYSLWPIEFLGPIICGKGPPNQAKVYPQFGSTPQEGHGDFAARGGLRIWAPDVFAFLDDVMK